MTQAADSNSTREHVGRWAEPTLLRLDSYPPYSGAFYAWGVQRGEAPLRFFKFPHDWGIQGVDDSDPGDHT